MNDINDKVLDKYNSDLNNLTDEMIARKILSDANVNINDVPIVIEKVAENLGFTIGQALRFVDDEIVAGIAYRKEQHPELENNRYIVVRHDINLRERRYLISLAVVLYVLESKGKHYSKRILKDVITNYGNTQEERVARATLMPLKSMSMLLNSPMIRNMDIDDKISNVAKAFLVPNQAAKVRMVETGFLL